MAKRKSDDTTLGVTKEARDELVRYLATKNNPTVRDVVTSLIRRFLSLPEPVRTALLNSVDEGMEPAYAAALRAMADELLERYKAREGIKPTGSRKGNGPKPGVTQPPPGSPSSDPPPARDATKRSA